MDIFIFPISMQNKKKTSNLKKIFDSISFCCLNINSGVCSAPSTEKCQICFKNGELHNTKKKNYTKRCMNVQCYINQLDVSFSPFLIIFAHDFFPFYL